MAKYKLIKKVNPQKRQEPGKWYATPKSETPLSGKAMIREPGLLVLTEEGRAQLQAC